MTAVTATKKSTRADRIKGLELAVETVNASTFSSPGAVTIAFAEAYAEFIATGATPETEGKK